MNIIIISTVLLAINIKLFNKKNPISYTAIATCWVPFMIFDWNIPAYLNVIWLLWVVLQGLAILQECVVKESKYG